MSVAGAAGSACARLGLPRHSRSPEILPVCRILRCFCAGTRSCDAETSQFVYATVTVRTIDCCGAVSPDLGLVVVGPALKLPKKPWNVNEACGERLTTEVAENGCVPWSRRCGSLSPRHCGQAAPRFVANRSVVMNVARLASRMCRPSRRQTGRRAEHAPFRVSIDPASRPAAGRFPSGPIVLFTCGLSL